MRTYKTSEAKSCMPTRQNRVWVFSKIVSLKYCFQSKTLNTIIYPSQAMRKRDVTLFIFLVLVPAVLAPDVLAKRGEIRLLALTEKDGSTKGTIAELELELQPGSERVYLETTPFTKMATQISLRFAQQIACKELDKDCTSLDFLYTIKALPGIVGGPSAGAGAAVLTASLLNGLELKEDASITGTINSGGIIGPVGGIDKKITAAGKAGIKKVLIPKGSRFHKDGENTTDLYEHGKKAGVEVIEVATLDEALYHLTGFRLEKPKEGLVIEERYKNIMKDVSKDLCRRNDEIEKEVSAVVLNDLQLVRQDEAVNFSRKAEEAFEKGEYYSSASYCFRSNVLLRRDLFALKKLSKDEVMQRVFDLKKKAEDYSKELEARQIKTITDIQTYMAVQERLFEVYETLFNILEGVGSTEERFYLLAYAEERFYSVLSWAKFFDGKDRRFDLTEERLKESCIDKISEAEERYNYVKSILQNDLERTKKELEKAYYDLNNESYISCLYGASKAKAEADIVMSVLGVEESRFNELIDLKLGVAKTTIVNAQKQNIFPIIGYSYYEYSSSLKEVDKYSSLLFAEYALELSNLDIYFEKKEDKQERFFNLFNKQGFAFLAIGLGLGIILALAAVYAKRLFKPKEPFKITRIRRVKTLQTSRIGRLRGKKR